MYMGRLLAITVVSLYFFCDVDFLGYLLSKLGCLVY